MKPPVKIVISASRRTDIPAFYMPWFMQQIQKGVFEVVNPYNQQVTSVSTTADNVHTIVFWSKNFGPFINEHYGQKLRKLGYNLFFNFTINSTSPRLEPHVPPLDVRLAQLKQLSIHFGSSTINWRFDPICFYKTRGKDVHDNLSDFNRIAARAAEYKIRRCITSFMDLYPKINKRLVSGSGLSFLDPDLETKKQIVLKMEKILAAQNISLQVCCEKQLWDALPADSSVVQSACIPNDLLEELFGGRLSLKKDRGQRVQKGCGCKTSVDIGSYRYHPCYHNCLFCYANPASR